MPKLLITILAIFSISVALLQLRGQRLHDRYTMNHLHNQIEDSQAKLWNQQLKIAAATTPQNISNQIREYGLPGSEADENHKKWLEMHVNPE